MHETLVHIIAVGQTMYFYADTLIPLKHIHIIFKERPEKCDVSHVTVLNKIATTVPILTPMS